MLGLKLNHVSKRGQRCSFNRCFVEFDAPTFWYVVYSLCGNIRILTLNQFIHTHTYIYIYIYVSSTSSHRLYVNIDWVHDRVVPKISWFRLERVEWSIEISLKNVSVKTSSKRSKLLYSNIFFLDEYIYTKLVNGSLCNVRVTKIGSLCNVRIFPSKLHQNVSNFLHSNIFSPHDYIYTKVVNGPLCNARVTKIGTSIHANRVG